MQLVELKFVKYQILLIIQSECWKHLTFLDIGYIICTCVYSFSFALHRRAIVITRVWVFRPSSVKPLFSETVEKNHPKFWGKLPVHHISRHIFFPFWLNLKVLIFNNFYGFVNMGPYGRNISNDISSESTQQIHSQKFMNTPRKFLYQSCSKNCEF